jgi:hypothetical protein
MKPYRGFLLCFICFAAAVRTGANDSPTATVHRSSPSITLDGHLDEPAWQDAPVLKLVQQSPRPGLPTPYETEVRVILTDDSIYFGFRCKDPDPRHISIHTMRRDETMGRDGATKTDDTVSIILDTYGDHRTGYFFQINAAGTRTDGL